MAKPGKKEEVAMVLESLNIRHGRSEHRIMHRIMNRKNISLNGTSQSGAIHPATATKPAKHTYPLKLFIILAFAAFLMPVLASAIIYDVIPICKNPFCIIGENATWEIRVTNEGANEVEITAFELVDYYSTQSLALYRYTGKPSVIYRDAPGGIKVAPKTNVTFNISGILPSPVEFRRLVYFPCFNLEVNPWDTYHISRNIHEVRYCSKVNQSLTVVECNSPAECSPSQECRSHNCIDLECGECEQAVANKCARLECCSSGECPYDSYCLNNTCQPLQCSEAEFYFNNTCKALVCRDDEYLENRTCIALECAEDEHGVNHRCEKLKCAENQYMVPHACISLECAADEGYFEHACVKLECTYDQKIQDHKCVNLECNFLQDIKENNCVLSTKKITLYSLEALAVISIVLLLVLDVFKLKSRLLNR